MADTRQKSAWPISGFTDWSVGVSRLSDTLTGVEQAIKSGTQGFVKGAADAANKAEQDSADFLRADTAAGYESSSGSGSAGDSSEDSGGTGDPDMSIANALITEALKYVWNKDDSRGTSDKKIAYHWASAGPGHCAGDNRNSDTTSATPLGGYRHTACFDCSGYTSYLYKKVADITLERHSGAQIKKCTKILGQNPSASDLKSKPVAGDIIVFGPSEAGIHHVAICMGDKTGDFIEAPNTGKWVRISKLTSRSDIYGIYRRLSASQIESPSSGGSSTEGKVVGDIVMIYTTYRPGYNSDGSIGNNDSAMQGDNTTACGAKLTLDSDAPLGYKIKYKGKTYYYGYAAKFKNSKNGAPPRVPDVRFQKNHGKPKLGIAFEGDPSCVFFPFDVYAVDWKGKTLEANAMDILCAPTDKARKNLKKILGDAKIGKKSNGYSGSSTKVKGKIIDITKDPTPAPSERTAPNESRYLK